MQHIKTTQRCVSDCAILVLNSEVIYTHLLQNKGKGGPGLLPCKGHLLTAIERSWPRPPHLFTGEGEVWVEQREGCLSSSLTLSLADTFQPHCCPQHLRGAVTNCPRKSQRGSPAILRLLFPGSNLVLALLHTCHRVFFLTLEAGGKRTVINGATRHSPRLFHHGVIIVLLVCQSNLSVSPRTSSLLFVNPGKRQDSRGSDSNRARLASSFPICPKTRSFISSGKTCQKY